MKRISLMVSFALLCGLFSLFSFSAYAEQAGSYYIAVSVKDISTVSNSNYDSCNNSEGYVVVPTRRQDGYNGSPWYARVVGKSWDTDNITLWYYYGLAGQNHGGNQPGSVSNQTVDGFPREVRLTTSAAPASTDYIVNNNRAKTSKLRFTLWVSGDNRNWIQVQSWEETTSPSGRWSDSKTVDSSSYPKPWGIGEINGADEMMIPLPGGEAGTVQFVVPVYDQYGVRWYQDNAGVTWSLTGAPDGISISENGLLMVTDAVLQAVNGEDFQITVQATGGDGSVKSKTLTVHWPQCSVSYYDYDGTLLYGPYTAACNSAVNHPADHPTRATDENGRYTFERWDSGQGSISTITRDTVFTAVYTKTPHSWTYNSDRTRRTCDECGFVQEGDDLLYHISVAPMVGGSVSVTDKEMAEGEVTISIVPLYDYVIGTLTASYIDEYGEVNTIELYVDEDTDEVSLTMPAYDIEITGTFRKLLSHRDITADYNSLYQYYTGTVLKPTIKDGDKTLTEGVDYTIIFEKDYTGKIVEPVNAGFYYFTCKGIGEYAGEYYDTLEISPIGTVYVYICGNNEQATYDGETHTVSGFTIEAVDQPEYASGTNLLLPKYNPETDMVFTGNATISETDAGEYSLELNPDDFQNTNSNFEVDFEIWHDIELDILPADVTVTLTGNQKTVVYNGQNQRAEGYTFSSDNPLYTRDDCYSDDFSVEGCFPGQYEMTISDCDNLNSNFNVTFNVVPGYLVIERRPVTFTAKDQMIKAGEEIDFNCSSVDADGLAENHYLSFIEFGWSSSSIGTSTIEIYDALIEDAEGPVNDWYDISYDSGTLTVEPRQLSVYYLRGIDREYDGTKQIEIDYSEAEIGGDLQYGDELVISEVQGHLASENAGENKDVLIDSITFKPSDDLWKYEVRDAEATVNIRKKPISATVEAENKTYDGLTETAVTAMVDEEDLVSRGGRKDTLVLGGLYGEFEDANAGVGKPVAVHTDKLVITGSGAGNYEVSVPAATTADIDKAENPVVFRGDVHLAVGDTLDLTTCVSNAIGDVTWAISGDAGGCTLTGSRLKTGSTAGGCTVTATVAESSNYYGTSGEIAVNIGPRVDHVLQIQKKGGYTTGYHWEGGTLTVTDPGTYYIFMPEGANATTVNRVSVNTSATVTLAFLNIDQSGTDQPALYAAGGSTFILYGDNTLISGTGRNGIETDGSPIAFTSAGGDGKTVCSLNVTGGAGACGLPENVTVRGATIRAAGTWGAGAGLTVTGGDLTLQGTDEGSAVSDGAVAIDFGSGKAALFENGTEVEGSPFTGNNQVGGLTGKNLMVRAWQSPTIRLTNAAKEHLLKIWRSDDTVYYEQNGQTSVDAALDMAEAGQTLFFEFDYPIDFIAGGSPEPMAEPPVYAANLFRYGYRLVNCGTLDGDLSADAVTVAFLGQDEKTLYTEVGYAGQTLPLYQPENPPGWLFGGWIYQGEIISGEYAFNESVTLTGNWVLGELHSIACPDTLAAWIRDRWEPASQARVGEPIMVFCGETKPPVGKYLSGCLVNGANSTLEFLMPDEDVTLQPVYADQSSVILDLTGSGADISQIDQEWFYDALDDNADWWQIEGIEENQYGIDIDEDGVVDCYLTYDKDWDELLSLTRGPGAERLMGDYVMTGPWCPIRFVFRFAAPVFGNPDFTLPAFLTTIEEEAFEGAAMHVVYIPDACTLIDTHAFRNCENLTQIRIPAGCDIGTDAFDGCGDVLVFGTAGSPAETYCETHNNCRFASEN